MQISLSDLLSAGKAAEFVWFLTRRGKLLVSMKITLTMSLLDARSLSRWILLRGSDTLPRPSCASSAWMPTLCTEEELDAAEYEDFDDDDDEEEEL